MKMLLVSQYLPPDQGGATKRLNNLLRLVDENDNKKIEITIIGGEQHYPIKNGNFSENSWPINLDLKSLKLKVKRVKMPSISHNTGIGRFINYVWFVIISILICRKNKNYDYVWGLSPNFFVYYSAKVISKINGAKLILDVPDLWPDAPIDLGFIKNNFLKKILFSLEADMYKKSDNLTTVSKGLKKAIINKTKIINKKVNVIPNWIRYNVDQEDNTTIVEKDESYMKKYEIIIGYLGIINDNYDFKKLLIFIKNNINSKLIIKGWGPKKDYVESLIKKFDLHRQVSIIDQYLSEKSLKKLISEWDYMAIPLKQNTSNKYILPAKLADAINANLPILNFVEKSYLQFFISKYQIGLTMNVNYDINRKHDFAKDYNLFVRNIKKVDIYDVDIVSLEFNKLIN